MTFKLHPISWPKDPKISLKYHFRLKKLKQINTSKTTKCPNHQQRDTDLTKPTLTTTIWSKLINLCIWEEPSQKWWRWHKEENWIFKASGVVQTLHTIWQSKDIMKGRKLKLYRNTPSSMDQKHGLSRNLMQIYTTSKGVTLVYHHHVNRWDIRKKMSIARLDFIQAYELSLNLYKNLEI